MVDQEISGETTVVASPRQVSTEVEGESVILSLDESVYYGLDGVGTRVWSLISEPRTVDELRNELVETYDVEPGRCGADLKALLTELSAAGLVELSSEQR